MVDKQRVVLFSGGRGSRTIARALATDPGIDLAIVINGYDDGLSTGVLRGAFPGLLGPSDFRKSANSLLSQGDSKARSLAQALETRLNLTDLDASDPIGQGQEIISRCNQLLEIASVKQFQSLHQWTSATVQALLSLGQTPIATTLNDAALGNLVLTGAWLTHNRDFNVAIEAYSEILQCPARILNVTAGENRVLVAVKESGLILARESEIVDSHQDASPIVDIFLLEDYPDQSDLESLKGMSLEDTFQWFQERESLPQINPAVDHLLSEADIVVYGPGTPHSSLLPSYLTYGIGGTIAHNDKAAKVFIANVDADLDSGSDSIRSVLSKAVSCFNRSSLETLQESSLVTHLLIHRDAAIPEPWGWNKSDLVTFPNLYIASWVTSDKKHDGGRVTRGLKSLAPRPASSVDQDDVVPISIVVPVLDEDRTLAFVLEQLALFDWLSFGYRAEIVVVDGGSCDDSWRVARSTPGVRCFQLSRGCGRGEAIAFGIEKAQGHVVVTFPADAEYTVDDIPTLVDMINEHNAHIVFGSRAAFCADSDERLREIYGGRNSAYILSKWGGVALSTVSALRWKRWVADPLTSLKAFSRQSLVVLSMAGTGLDWDTRVIVDSRRLGYPISEVPVAFQPRTRAQGKKTTARSGAKALLTLLIGGS